MDMPKVVAIAVINRIEIAFMGFFPMKSSVGAFIHLGTHYRGIKQNGVGIFEVGSQFFGRNFILSYQVFYIFCTVFFLEPILA